jgi:hypothetical protein
MTAEDVIMRYQAKEGSLFHWLFILILFFIVLACSQKTSEDGEKEPDDPCSNALGNGNEIISGPSGPEGGDYDQVFRSLEVDPANPDVLYIGTERNGLVKSADGGLTWQRLRKGIRHNAATYSEVWDIDVSPSNSQFVIAAIADSPGPVSYPESPPGVYISMDAGATWKRSNCGLTNSYVAAVRTSQTDS